VSALAVGASAGSLIFVRAGAWLLAGGVVFFGLNTGRVLAHLRIRPGNAHLVGRVISDQPEHL
jgi:hypothetical protein